MIWFPTVMQYSQTKAYAWGLSLSRSIGVMDGSDPGFNAQVAYDAWLHIERKYGASKTTRHNRALALAELGRFDLASKLEKRAGNVGAALALSGFAAIKRRIAHDFHLNILSALRLSADRYVVLVSKFGKIPMVAGDDLWFALVGTGGSSLKLKNRINLNVPGMTSDSRVQMMFRDFDGDGRPEILVHQVYPGASWTPSSADILCRNDGNWKFCASLFSHDPLILERPVKGKCRITQDFAVGVTLSHGSMPRWMLTWEWWHGRLHLVNRDYPTRYRNLRNQIIRLMKGHSRNDAELWHFRAQAERYLDMEAAAQKSDRRARECGWVNSAEYNDFLNPRNLNRW